MSIAVIGWGSLIWSPDKLRIKTKWRMDGPSFPIEFARISEDGRLTLVIHPGSPLQQTYWALSEFSELEEARANLSEREGCSSIDAIHFCTRESQSQSMDARVHRATLEWLGARDEIKAVIWSGLRSNWSAKRGREFSPQEAIGYLDELEAQHDQTKFRYERAREYIRNAPSSIQTEVRKIIHRRGWRDALLPTTLFEDQEGERRSVKAIQICRGFTDKQWQKLRPCLVNASQQIQDNNDAWECALEVFDRRMRERFFSGIDALERADSRLPYVTVSEDAPANCSVLPRESATVPGFSIMAICCLLMETLQSFRNGEPKRIPPDSCPAPASCANQLSGSNQAFREFLLRRGSKFSGVFDKTSSSAFVNGIRNGIFHDAETRGWVIWRNNPNGKVVDKQDGVYVLDRTRFCSRLREEYQCYIEEVRSASNDKARPNFINGMDGIVNKCRKLR